MEDEKRTVIGVEEEVKCGAEVRSDAAAVGVKVPVRRCPFACAVVVVLASELGLHLKLCKERRWIWLTWSETPVWGCGAAKGGHEAIAGLKNLSI